MSALVRHPWLLAAFVVPGTAAYFGVQFDVAWHIDRGRDHFDIPPHLVMIAGMQAGGLLFAGLLLWTARLAASGRPLATPLARWHGRQFSPLALVALACFAAPGIVIGIDEGWHRVFGLDVSAWSPTHLTALYTAALAGLAFAAFLAAELNALVPGRRRPGRRRLRDLDPAEGWLVYTIALFGAGLLVLLVEYDFDVPQFDLAFAAILLPALSAFPVFAGRAALGAGGGATLTAGAIVGFKVLTVALLLALGRTHPDVPVGIVAGALAADVALSRGRRGGALVAYPVVLLGFEWARLELLGQPQWTAGLWPLGAALGVGAAVATGALGTWAGWALRPAGDRAPLPEPSATAARRLLPASALVVALAVAAPALAHGGYTRDVVLSRLSVSPAHPAPGEVLRVRLQVGERTRDGRPAPFLAATRRELGAFRAGEWLREPLRRTGSRTFEGELRLDEPGRWVIWPRFDVGDERWIDRTHLAVEPGGPPGGTARFVTEIAPEPDPDEAPGWLKPLAYLAMLAIWSAVTVAMVRSLRIVARFGFA